ncbi:MAG TPA: hypothetical protein VKG79_02150, partial [Bryobacteraceae bacterium]|nr:hypothetical protein [Bryobacteraceae bacterium]
MAPTPGIKPSKKAKPGEPPDTDACALDGVGAGAVYGEGGVKGGGAVYGEDAASATGTGACSSQNTVPSAERRHVS